MQLLQELCRSNTGSKPFSHKPHPPHRHACMHCQAANCVPCRLFALAPVGLVLQPVLLSLILGTR